MNLLCRFGANPTPPYGLRPGKKNQKPCTSQCSADRRIYFVCGVVGNAHKVRVLSMSSEVLLGDCLDWAGLIGFSGAKAEKLLKSQHCMSDEVVKNRASEFATYCDYTKPK